MHDRHPGLSCWQPMSLAATSAACRGEVLVFTRNFIFTVGTPELSRLLRTSLCFFWGRANLPLPRKHDILSAVGPTVTGACLRSIINRADICHMICRYHVAKVLCPHKNIKLELNATVERSACLTLSGW